MQILKLALTLSHSKVVDETDENLNLLLLHFWPLMYCKIYKTKHQNKNIYYKEEIS